LQRPNVPGPRQGPAGPAWAPASPARRLRTCGTSVNDANLHTFRTSHRFYTDFTLILHTYLHTFHTGLHTVVHAAPRTRKNSNKRFCKLIEHTFIHLYTNILHTFYARCTHVFHTQFYTHILHAHFERTLYTQSCMLCPSTDAAHDAHVRSRPWRRYSPLLGSLSPFLLRSASVPPSLL
jgi:hypothetical protein